MVYCEYTYISYGSADRIIFFKSNGTADPLDRARESIFMVDAMRRRSLPRSRHSEVE